MTSKADQVRAWLNGSDLGSREIAEAVGCHPGFVRALKQRMLHPERERKRHRDYYSNNVGGCRDKQREYLRNRWRTDAEFRERELERRAKYRRAEREARP